MTAIYALTYLLLCVLSQHCPWIDNCVGQYNHLSFVLFMIALIVGMSLYNAIAIIYLIYATRTPGQYVMVSLLMLHAFLLSFYCLLLLWQQKDMITRNMTTNEKINSWRYVWFRKIDPATGRAKFYNPFDNGIVNNMLVFCRLISAKKVDVDYSSYTAATNEVPILPFDALNEIQSVQQSLDNTQQYGHTHADGSHHKHQHAH